MKRLVALCALVAVCALCLAAVPSAHAEKAMTVHFVVIKDNVPGVDYAKEVPALKDALCRMAGGYTALGATSGGSLHEGLPEHTQSNHSYLVAAPENIAGQIAEYVEKHFGDLPFILAWPGTMH